MAKMLTQTPALLLNLSIIRPVIIDPNMLPTPSTLRANKPAASYYYGLSSGMALSTIVMKRPDQYAVIMPI